MLEGYITPLLMSYISKYVNNIKPSDLKVSFWGGDAVLRNLELCLDVLEKELSIPLEFKSGFIRELTIHLPWSAIASTSVEVIIKDLELVVKLKSLRHKAPSDNSQDGEKKAPDSSSNPKPADLSLESEVRESRGGKESSPPGYLQGYMNRILNNVRVCVKNMVVKVLEEECDLMLTLNIGTIDFFTTNKAWEREFVYTDYFQGTFSLFKVCEVKDIAVNLHPIELGEKPQGSLLHEPFIKRFSTICRVKFEYHDKILLRKSVEVLIGTLELSVDERQFCLMLHLSDWLLAMYYKSKKLKGRNDDVFCVNSEESKERQEVKTEDLLVAGLEESVGDYDNNRQMKPLQYAESSEAGSRIRNETVSTSDTEDATAGGNWGSWIWSVVGGTEGEEEVSPSVENPLKKRGRDSSKWIGPEHTKLHFSIMAKSVMVSFKMTQQVQVPVFLSLRSFISPVMAVHFTECMLGVDRCPFSPRTLVVSMGIMGIKGEVMGLCPCVKKYPSSWRRASSTATTDCSKVVRVFSLGCGNSKPRAENKLDIESPSDDAETCKDGEQRFLKYSLFAPDLSSTGNDDAYPLEIHNSFLEELGRSFKAVWFTYNYHDVGTESSVEECTETLVMGVVNAVFSPDVIHRLELFVLSFKTSLEAIPLSSKGMAVLGDPKAVTCLKLSLAGVRILLTSSSHYLPIMTSPSLKTQHLSHSLKQSKKSPMQSNPPLPCLCITLDGSRADVMFPMYKNTASLNVPQKVHFDASMHGIMASLLIIQTLANGIEMLMREPIPLCLREDRVLELPLANSTYHAVSFGEAGSDCEDTSYLRLDIATLSTSLSIQQISKLVFVVGSWKRSELNVSPPPSSASSSMSGLKYCSPLISSRTLQLAWILVSLADIGVCMSRNSKFKSVSATLGIARLSVAHDSSGKKSIPVLFGPMNSTRWNKVESFQCHEKSTADIGIEMSCPGKKLAEFLKTSPQDNFRGQMFPTLQLSISGFCLSLEPVVLEFLQLLSFHSLHALSVIAAHPDAATSSSCPNKTMMQMDLPYTLTPTASVADEEEDGNWEHWTGEQNSILSAAKLYAVKVEVEPILLVFPTFSDSSSAPGRFQDLFKPIPIASRSDFPILIQLVSLCRPSVNMSSSQHTPLASTHYDLSSSSSCSAPSALVLSFPHILLESAKSHVLDEPVPMLGRTDTLPWDCSLTNASLLTVSCHSPRYLLEPLAMKATLAAQQEGLGVTVHLETMVLSLSRKQVHLVRQIVSDIAEKVVSLTTRPSVSVPSGINSPKTAMGKHILVTPTTPSATPSLPTASDISTMSSSYQGMSSVWLQLLVSRGVLHLYGREDSRVTAHPSSQRDEDGETSVRTSSLSPSLRVTVEVESLSLQVDVQERCTDFILKMAGMESDLRVLSKCTDGSDLWMPYLIHSKGKLFSSVASNFPDDILHVTALGLSANQFQSSGLGIGTDVFSPRLSPKLHSSFVYIKGYISTKVPRAPKLEVNMRPFEVVVWLPVIALVLSVIGSGSKSKKTTPITPSPPPLAPHSPAAGDTTASTWPSLLLTLDCFRVVFPSRDLLHSCLLTSAGLRVTSAVEFAGPEVRFVTNQHGYQRLSLLSAERKRPPLPAYQCDSYSVAVWGIAGGIRSTLFLYLSNSDVQVTYTPRLDYAPLSKRLQEPTGLRSPTTTTTAAATTMVCGHSLEVNFSNDFSIFAGLEQVSNILEILKTNRFGSYTDSKNNAKDGITEKLRGDGLINSSAGVAFKVLITGKTITGLLLTPSPSPPMATAAEVVRVHTGGCDMGMTRVLFLLSLYNPVLSFWHEEDIEGEGKEGMRRKGRKRCGEVSVFDMAVAYNRDTAPMAYSDLTDGVNLPSPAIPILQTRRELINDKTELSPNLLNMTWSHSSSDGSTGAAGPNTSLVVKLDRMCKLVCGPAVLQDCVKVARALASQFRPPERQEESGESKERSMEKEEAVYDNETSGRKEKIFAEAPFPKVQLTTGQVLLELVMSDREEETTSWMERNSSSPEEDQPCCSSTSSSKESILVSWDKLTFSAPSSLESSLRVGLTPCSPPGGALCVSGLQLLSSRSGCTEYVVPPVRLHVSVAQHQPNSKLDQVYLSVSVSLGLLDVRMSQCRLLNILSAVQLLSLCVEQGLTSGSGTNLYTAKEGKKRSNLTTRSSSGKKADMVVRHFVDDLRVGDFKYVVDDSDCPVLPSAGEIVFHCGTRGGGSGSGQPPSMCWHYWEPRNITKLQVLPIPFAITDKDGAPLISPPNTKVVCSLDYWDEQTSSFVSVGYFSVSETCGTELADPSGGPAGRLWRVTLMELCCSEEEHLYQLETMPSFVKGHFTGDHGEKVLISEILSPLSLAACTQVDSSFSPLSLSSLSLALSLDMLQFKLLHNPRNSAGSQGDMFDGYHVTETTGAGYSSRCHELLKLSVSKLRAHVRVTKPAAIELMADGSCALSFVDFGDLRWRTALYPVHTSLHFQFHHNRDVTHHKGLHKEASISADGPSLTLAVKMDPAVVKLSQGLHYTVSVALHAWKDMMHRYVSWRRGGGGEMESEAQDLVGTTVPTLLPNYFIVCNDTNKDLIIGQENTAEKLPLPSCCCVCYSWYSHASTPHMLRIALASEDMAQWTSSFSVANAASLTYLQVPMRCPSLLTSGSAHVSVVERGGMQKQVSVYGNWKFFSTLHISLDLRLGIVSGFEDEPFLPCGQIWTLHPGEKLPSILAPELDVGGVILKASNGTSDWSAVYPFPVGGERWSKPRLLIELDGEAGVKIQFWFNIEPMSTFSRPCGHQVTFSPLFAVRNHLPLDLELIVSQDSSPTVLAGRADSNVVSTLPGNGQTQSLPSLCADRWYWLKFSVSTGSAAVSEPPVSLSTFLLHHLPFSPAEQSSPSASSPSSLISSASFSIISLPLDSCRLRICKVQVTFLRSTLNTIVVDLRPEWLVSNATSLRFVLVEPALDEVDVEEREVECLPFSNQVLCQNEFAVRTQYKELPLLSNLICCPALPPFTPGGKAGGEVSATAETLPCTPLMLISVLPASTEASNHQDSSVVGEAMVSFQRHDSPYKVKLKPSFILHNNTTYKVQVIPCLTGEGQSCDHRQTHAHVMEELEPKATCQLLYWNLTDGLTPSTKTAITHSILVTGCVVDGIRSFKTIGSPIWSLHLSTDFVRHSFSLPISDASQSSIPCLLTMHEKSDITYLVLQEDRDPPVLIQNLLSADFQVVETQVRGLDVCPQSLPAQQEVVYHPPSLAKLYPIVYDKEMATERDRKVLQAAQSVKIKIRCTGHGDLNNVDGCSWSNFFPIVCDSDKIVSIPEFGDVLISSMNMDRTLFLSLLPTGDHYPQKLFSCQGIKPQISDHLMSVRYEINLAHFVCSLIDDVSKKEILRTIISKMEGIYSRPSQDDAKLDLTLQSLRIDNFAGYHSMEFAVCLLPRSEHAAPSQLFQQEDPPLLKLLVHYSPRVRSNVHSFYLRVAPVTMQLEDCLWKELKRIVKSFKQPALCFNSDHVSQPGFDCVPVSILQESERDVHSVMIASFVVEPIIVYLSARITLKAFLSCNDTPLKFSSYELENVCSNWFEITQVVAARYVSALFMHAGWVLGSMELIGSPVSFVQSVGRGLRDLLSLPYEGLTRSPGMFILGMGQGMASFLRQSSSGALTSITNLAHSVARNMERLSMDQDHVMYQDQLRQERTSTHFAAGMALGVSSLGLSLMSAVAGLVEQPMQSVQQMEESDRAAPIILKGIGKGLIGVVTKPVGGAMELISKTGQGIMSRTGLANKLEHCKVLEELAEFVSDRDGRQLLLASSSYFKKLGEGNIAFLLLWEATDNPGGSLCFTLLLTTTHVLIWDACSDSLLKTFVIKNCEVSHWSPTSTSTLHSKHNLQVKLHIMTCQQVGDQKKSSERRQHDFEMVEQYLQLAGAEEMQQPETVLVAEDVVMEEEDCDLEFCSSEERVSEAVQSGESGGESYVGGGNDDMLVCLEEHDAAQFLTVYNLIKNNDMYGVQFS